MKNINIIIFGIAVFILILLVGCVKEEVILCDDFPDNSNCICSEGLIKQSTPYGYFCANTTCSHCTDKTCKKFFDPPEFTLKGRCVSSCSENYYPFEVHNEDGFYYQFCFSITNQSEMFCERYPSYQNCVCPEGQKQIHTQGGIECVNNSFCLDYILSDVNKSLCVKDCPKGYIPLSITDVGSAGSCINIKEIDQDNYWIYGGYLFRHSNASFMKYYKEHCLIVDEIERKDKYEIKLMCDTDFPYCSFYIYPDATFEDAGCLNTR